MPMTGVYGFFVIPKTDKTIVVGKGGFDAVRHIVVQCVPIKSIVVTGAVGSVALIDAIARKIGGVADENTVSNR